MAPAFACFVLLVLIASGRFRAACWVGADPGVPPRQAAAGVALTLAGERGLFPAFLYVYVADADETYRRALEAGAETLEAPLDTPYGDRRAMARDP